jgi:hypothetical protein
MSCFWIFYIVIFYLKLDVSETKFSLLQKKKNIFSLDQSIKQVPISGNLHQHRIGYTNQTQHNPSARVNEKYWNIKKLHMYEA